MVRRIWMVGVVAVAVVEVARHTPAEKRWDLAGSGLRRVFGRFVRRPQP